ncbi:MAG: hypothetical protein COA43_01120 [Robiginitomaculum sp.]|nr:MAG: hypothetical protein COA43_01120 [Robiginitomaculum sp.]
MDTYTYSAENVAKRLSQLRKYLKLNQKEFAKSIDVGYTQYNNWEKAKQRLSLEGGLKINAVYGTTLDFLFLNRRDTLPHAMAVAFAPKPLALSSKVSNEAPDD